LARIKQTFNLAPEFDSLLASFETEDSCYDAIAMLVFALTTNREISRAKAEIFWDLFDSNYDGYLNKPEIELMLDTLFMCALKPCYVGSVFGGARILYGDRLKGKIQATKQVLLDEFFKNRAQLLRTEFINRVFRDKEMSFLMDTALIRKRLEEDVSLST
jgi:hypothetical protein